MMSLEAIKIGEQSLPSSPGLIERKVHDEVFNATAGPDWPEK